MKSTLHLQDLNLMLFATVPPVVPRANGVPPQLAAVAATTTNGKCGCARCEFGLMHRGDQLFPLAAESPSSPPSEPLGSTAVGGCCHHHRRHGGGGSDRLPSIESACAYDDMDKDTQV